MTATKAPSNMLSVNSSSRGLSRPPEASLESSRHQRGGRAPTLGSTVRCRARIAPCTAFWPRAARLPAAPRRERSTPEAPSSSIPTTSPGAVFGGGGGEGAGRWAGRGQGAASPRLPACCHSHHHPPAFPNNLVTSSRAGRKGCSGGQRTASYTDKCATGWDCHSDATVVPFSPPHPTAVSSGNLNH